MNWRHTGLPRENALEIRSATLNELEHLTPRLQVWVFRIPTAGKQRKGKERKGLRVRERERESVVSALLTACLCRRPRAVLSVLV